VHDVKKKAVFLERFFCETDREQRGRWRRHCEAGDRSNPAAELRTFLRIATVAKAASR
jgi:hypothetical protein